MEERAASPAGAARRAAASDAPESLEGPGWETGPDWRLRFSLVLTVGLVSSFGWLVLVHLIALGRAG